MEKKISDTRISILLEGTKINDIYEEKIGQFKSCRKLCPILWELMFLKKKRIMRQLKGEYIDL